MAIIGGSLGYRVLKTLWPRQRMHAERSDVAYFGKSKIAILLGESIREEVKGKIVVDFGCGAGDESVEIASCGASKVIGVDIQQRFLDLASAKAVDAGVSEHCVFTQEYEGTADLVVSLDAFEHFADPKKVLESMSRMLNPTGQILVTFGPTWFHPFGGHTFSVFPWAHLIFSEKALIRWRNDFKDDGATRFSEVAGGLNQMTIARFERLVSESPLRFVEFNAVPIRGLRAFSGRLTREFTTAIVQCRLELRH